MVCRSVFRAIFLLPFIFLSICKTKLAIERNHYSDKQFNRFTEIIYNTWDCIDAALNSIPIII